MTKTAAKCIDTPINKLTPVSTWVEGTIQKDTYKWWVLVVVQISIFLMGLDSTIVNLALPTISKSFNVSVALSQWVIAAFFMANALSLLAAGRLADMLGRKSVFIGGFAVFTISSVLCGLAPNVEILITMRVIQAMGGAALLANSNVISLAVFPHRQHGLAMGINGTVFSIGYALGFTVGGWVIYAFGWRGIFLMNLPFGIIAIALGSFILIESRLTLEKKTGQTFDYLGMIFSVLGIGGLMLGANGYAKDGRWDSMSVALMIAGVASMVAFVVIELKSSCPLLDLRVFRLPVFSLGIVTRAMGNGVMGACVFLIPFYSQVALGLSPVESGWLMLPYAIALSLCGPLAGRLCDRFGARWLTSGAFLLYGTAAATFLMLKVIPSGGNLDGTMTQIVLGLSLLGAANGLFISPNNAITLDAVPSYQTGMASGCLWCVGFLGIAEGTALSAATLHRGEQMAGSMYQAAGTIDPALETILLRQQADIFHALILVCIVGCAICLLRGSGDHVEKVA